MFMVRRAQAKTSRMSSDTTPNQDRPISRTHLNVVPNNIQCYLGTMKQVSEIWRQGLIVIPCVRLNWVQLQSNASPSFRFPQSLEVLGVRIRNVSICCPMPYDQIRPTRPIPTVPRTRRPRRPAFRSSRTRRTACRISIPMLIR
jgi:hypothetical protein